MYSYSTIVFYISIRIRVLYRWCITVVFNINSQSYIPVPWVAHATAPLRARDATQPIQATSRQPFATASRDVHVPRPFNGHPLPSVLNDTEPRTQLSAQHEQTTARSGGQEGSGGEGGTGGAGRGKVDDQ